MEGLSCAELYKAYEAYNVNIFLNVLLMYFPIARCLFFSYSFHYDDKESLSIIDAYSAL